MFENFYVACLVQPLRAVFVSLTPITDLSINSYPQLALCAQRILYFKLQSFSPMSVRCLASLAAAINLDTKHFG